MNEKRAKFLRRFYRWIVEIARLPRQIAMLRIHQFRLVIEGAPHRRRGELLARARMAIAVDHAGAAFDRLVLDIDPEVAL